MKIRFSYYFLLLLIPVLGTSQIYSPETFGDILYGKDSFGFFGSEFVHVTNNNEYVIGYDKGYLQVFKVDMASGMPVEHYMVENTDIGDWFGNPSIENYAVTSDDSLIVINENARLNVFGLNGSERVYELKTYFNLPEGYSPNAIAISNDDNYLFVTAGDALLTYRLNASSGEASLIAKQDLGLDNDLIVENTSSNDRLALYAEIDSILYIYKMDEQSFEFSQENKFEEDVENGLYVRFITDIEADSNGNLYVTSSRDASLMVLSFSDREQTYIHKYSYANLESADAIAIDPSQEIIYVLDQGKYISAFAWNAHNELTFVDRSSLGADYYFANSITVSSNGLFLYAGLWSNVLLAKVKLGAFLNIGEDVHACYGDTVTISTDRAFPEVEWSTGDSGNKEFVIVSDTVLSVSVTDNYGRKGADTVNVEFENPIEFSTGRNITLTEGVEIEVKLLESYSSYEWSNGSTDSAITIDIGPFDADTNLIVEVVSNYGCVMSDTLSIDIDSKNSVAVNESASIICIAETSRNMKITSDESALVKIYTINGVVVYEHSLCNRELSISKARLPQGILIIDVVSEFETKTKIISNL